MAPLGDPCRHYWLVQDMARAVGADLVGAFESGRLTTARWAEMVRACRGCARSDSCRGWPKDGQGAAVIPPEWCRNRDRLLSLRLQEELVK